MKALLVLALLAVDGGTPKPKPCVVHTPSGPRACLPEPKPPSNCVVKVKRPDGSERSIPCR